MAGEKFKRLPTDVIPCRYWIKLYPNLIDFKFKGEERVLLKVQSPTSEILLNANRLTLQTIEVFQNEQKVESHFEFNQETQVITVQLKSTLKEGEATLVSHFEGIHGDHMEGFYRLKYKDSTNSETRYAVGTQFESVYARQAFPCWDEPAFKAVFDIEMVADSKYAVLSNMPISEEKDLGSNLKLVKFESSPIMSTYLVAFVVGDFDYIEAFDKNGIRHRVYALAGQAKLGEFALDISCRTLPFYTDFYKTPYPLPKLDLIALPDFAAGAMENWGLITYREKLLLVDPEQSSTSSKQYVAIVVAHELAHQWFGNLVTMEWWTDLWLNEGFASWTEYLAVDYCCPEYKIWSQYLNQSLIPALKLDALKNSHPIEVIVNAPSEIEEIFDNISYDKGSALISMLYMYLGEETFRNGLKRYIDRYAYKNACTDQLWACLSEASGKDIVTIMAGWTRQMGFPVVSATKANNQIQLSQERFLLNGETDSTTWQIPIQLKSENSVTLHTLCEKQQMFDLEKCGWTLLNPGAHTFCHIQYDDALLEDLQSALHSGSLTEEDKVMLFFDLFQLVRSGRKSVVDFLKLIFELKNTEHSYIVWEGVLTSLDEISIIVNIDSDSITSDALNNYRRKLVSSEMQRLGWETIQGESHFDALLRTRVISELGKSSHEQTVNECISRCEKVLSSGSFGDLHADFRAAVFATAIRHGDRITINRAIRFLEGVTLSEEKVRLLTALGHVRHPELLNHILQYVTSDNVRSQDAVYTLFAMSQHYMGREVLWAYFKNNFERIVKRFTGYPLTNIVCAATAKFASVEKKCDIETFFGTNLIPCAERTVKQSLEAIQIRVDWIKRDGPSLANYLLKFS